jgi:PAS domain S-box-containing protein
MVETLGGLFDTSGFPGRGQVGSGWTPLLVWLHVAGDLFIWLAFVSIPLVLLYFTRRRDLPYPRLFVLFALFILACGTTHLVDALAFEYPVYRFAAFMKVVTAVLSWAAVIALVPVVPRVMHAVTEARPAAAGDAARRPRAGRFDRGWDYVVAVLVGLLAVATRAALNPLVKDDHVFVLALLAVVYVSWQCGFGPGIACLVTTGVGYLFVVSPRQSLLAPGVGQQLPVALWFFCGVACAALGESQRVAQRRAQRALSTAVARQEALESEVARRRVVEAALRQREHDLVISQRETASALARLNAFLDNAPLGIAFFDTELRCERVNPFLAPDGKAVTPGEPRPLEEVLPDFPPGLLDAYRDAGAERKPITALVRRGEADSERVWQVTAFPVRGPDGSAFGAGVVAQDVTELKRTLDALRESESLFRSMADSVPALIWLSEADGQRTYFNKGWLEFTGRTLDQEGGVGWAEDIHPDDRDRYLAAYTSAIAERRPFELEYRLHRRDGAYRWVLARGTPRFTPGGAFAGLVGLCLDVTDRREDAESVRRAAERFRSLTEAVTQMVWTADTAGAVHFVNRRWEQYTGLAPEALGERDWGRELIHPDDAARVEAHWRWAVATQAAGYAEEFRLRRASDQSYRWMLSVAVPLRDAAGTVVEWVGTLTDIDDQKRQTETLGRMVRERTAELEEAIAALNEEIETRKVAEEQVRAVAAKLEQSNAELEKFAYIASHDLQEPLRKIQAFGDRLRDKCRDEFPEPGREYLDRMLAAAGRMRRLIDDLLALSRLATRRKPFQRIELGKLVRDVVSDLDVRIAEAGGRVRVGALPVVEADPTQMRQLFQNLIVNAVKFHQPGVPPVVEIDGELVSQPTDGEGEPVPMCRITVRDNGIGFDEKYRDRIFEAFQRLHGRNEYEGTGIGLAICKKIVERHGGTITAHSREGAGATFVVALPVSHPYSEEDDAEHDQSGQADHDPDGR